jgi:hypothetical protein
MAIVLGAALARAQDGNAPKLYVPYADIGSVIAPGARTVLMDRAAFEKLLAEGDGAARGAETVEVGQVTAAAYTGEMAGDMLRFTGKLTVRSLSDRPVSVPLRFAQLGLGEVRLDGKAAPLGYDRSGRLVVVVTGSGRHELTLSASTRLRELPGGGMQFSLGLPDSTAGEMTFTAPGDLEVHSTAPVAESRYDKGADRTTVRLGLGGQGVFSVVLAGNGRQEDQKAILLGNAATTVRIASTSETLNCLYTVQMLRRGLREMSFDLPAGWVVTDVSCPALVRWSVSADAKGSNVLAVQLRTAALGTRALAIEASRVRKGEPSWTSPYVRLRGADFEHGYLLADVAGELAIRGQSLRSARREDMDLAAMVPGLLPAVRGRLFYHWSGDWQVGLDLATAELRRSVDVRQSLVISPRQIALQATMEVTAVGREMFEIAAALPAGQERWQLESVQVNGKADGFEYRVTSEGGNRMLKIALAGAVRPEAVAAVRVSLVHVPEKWDWTSPEAAPRELSLPVVRPVADTVSGLVNVATAGDLDVETVKAPEALRAVPVGQMASLGLPNDVQAAWTHEKAVEGDLAVRVSCRQARIAAESVALVTVRPSGVEGRWRLDYDISRASVRRLYLLADKSLGRAIRIAPGGVALAARNIVAPGPETLPLSPELARAYDLWQLVLDSPLLGRVSVTVEYEQALPSGAFGVALVRPAGAGQTAEMLAVQASEELAVKAEAKGGEEIDAIDLPPLPAAASRLLAAWRLERASTPAGAAAEVKLTTTVHEKYAIPSALAADADVTTYLGADGSQRTAATFSLMNVGLQFLPIRLPKTAALWSVMIDGQPTKPKRDAAGDYLVAVPRWAAARSVTVVFAAPGGRGGGKAELASAELPGVKVNRLSWTVHPPPGEVIVGQTTAMDTTDLYRPAPAYETLLEKLDFLSELGTLGRRTVGAVAGRGEMAVQRAATDMDSFEYSKTRGGDATATPPPSAEPPPATRPAVRLSGSLDLAREDKRREKGGETDAPSAGVALAGGRLLTHRSEGRLTLPVELGATNSGPAATFSALGPGRLEVVLSRKSGESAWEWFGLAAALLAGLLLLRYRTWSRAGFIAAALAASTAAAIWMPAVTPFANGVFWAGMLLVAAYPAISLGRWIARKIGWADVRRTGAVASAAIMLALIVSVASAGESAKPQAAGAVGAVQRDVAQSRQESCSPVSEPLVIPYDGDPTKAEDARKVLVPYAKFVELWNRVHPAEQIDAPRGPVQVSLAGARYDATLAGERLNVTLTVEVRTFGKGWVTLPLPVSGLAVTEAAMDGKPAKLDAGPNGLVLTLAGESGRDAARPSLLVVKAVMTPKLLGRRGEARFSLPPLPAATMVVHLGDEDLVLEAPGAEGAVAKIAGAKADWLVALGTRRDVTLQWSPKVGAGAADKTLSAAAEHEVHAFHWGLAGVSKITFAFPAGEHGRFGLWMPEGATLTALTGANLRDFQAGGDKQVEGEKYKVVEVRLHRPASRQYELTARWVAPLEELGKSARLSLPRAAEVGRESGTVSLYAAGGMSVKVADVQGGRRSASGRPATTPQSGASVKVAEYYWPYRPFAINVELSRQDVEAAAKLDQLVRIDRRQVQLLVDATLTATRGRVFDASFELPEGFELLSAVGEAVEDHYEQKTARGRRLHVNFRSGQTVARLALVLVRKDVPAGELAVPKVTVLAVDARPAAEQTGRLAVQVAASLEAQTVEAKGLRSVPPRRLSGWLDGEQLAAVQFAYEYEKPDAALRLRVTAQPTKVRVEVLAGLSVRADSAWYSYRLRYNIEGTPLDGVKFTLPTRYAPLVAVNSPAMRSVTAAGVAGDRTEWTVSLLHEATGVLDVAVNFSVPLGLKAEGAEQAAAVALPIPRIVTAAPEGYLATIAVQNVSRHELRLGKTERLSAMPAGELEKFGEGEMRRYLQFVLQSFTDDWSAELEVKPAKAATRIQAVVDLLEIRTVIDRGGRARYEARVMLQNRSRQFLRVRVPAELELWSAVVADRPVKPVQDPNAAGGTVLIPLVKTSPGGLPYDVKMYFAGKAAGPLGAIGKLSPPAIGIQDVKTLQTTWSLRLPEGWRYYQPGGNLSPVAGEMESKLLAIKAELGQMDRYQQGYVEGLKSGSAKGQELYRDNWRQWNRQVSGKMKQFQHELQANSSGVSNSTISALNAKLAEQDRQQRGFNANWEKNEKDFEATVRNDVNGWVNNDVVNSGTAELARNAPLNTMPNFVQGAAEGQRRQLQTEISNSANLITLSGNAIDVAGALTTTSKGTVKLGNGTTILGGQMILAGEDDKRTEEVAEALEKLRKNVDEQVAVRQHQLKDQLDQLGDNRLNRYYKGKGGVADNLVEEGDRLAQAQPDSRSGHFSNVARKPPGPPAPRQAAGQRQGEGNGRGGGAGGGTMLGIAGGDIADAHDRPAPVVTPQESKSDWGAADGGERVAAGPAVAGGTFSLPVTLPEGGVQWAFEGPAERAAVTLWAVDARLVDAARATGGLAALLIVAWLVRQLWQELRLRIRRPAWSFIAAYVLLAGVLAALLAAGSMVVGLLAAGVIAGVVEVVHRLLSRRAA